MMRRSGRRKTNGSSFVTSARNKAGRRTLKPDGGGSYNTRGDHQNAFARSDEVERGQLRDVGPHHRKNRANGEQADATSRNIHGR